MTAARRQSSSTQIRNSTQHPRAFCDAVSPRRGSPPAPVDFRRQCIETGAIPPVTTHRMSSTMRFRFHSLIAALVIGFAAAAASAQDKAKAKEPSPDDQYVPGPDSKEQPGVPKG